MLCEGQALVEAGESYRQLAEVKYSMEDNVKQNFLDPLAHIQNKDLKEVNVSIFHTVFWTITPMFPCGFLQFFFTNGNRNECSIEELQNLQLYHLNCVFTLPVKTRTTSHKQRSLKSVVTVVNYSTEE